MDRTCLSGKAATRSIYNVVLVSGVPQSESGLHTPLSLFFRFFSHISHYRVLCKVPCAIQQVLISYLFIYSSVYLIAS